MALDPLDPDWHGEEKTDAAWARKQKSLRYCVIDTVRHSTHLRLPPGNELQHHEAAELIAELQYVLALKGA